ncbi:RimK family alpha-L-glutamate ligase [Virgibacillus halophilus]|uniref:ATP-grasp domain-containing protein n=1 Tax=Tigheibacillus halophilus TaxID=361280 RepID=UPI00363CC9F0
MKTTGWLIYRKDDAVKNESFIRWFMEEANNQNITLLLILRENLEVGIHHNRFTASYQQKTIQIPTLAIVRTIEPQLNFILEQMGIQVYNSSEISRICNHKGLTHLYVQMLGIPMVDTIFTKTDCLTETPPIPFPLVVKEVAGRGGKQVHFLPDQQTWQHVTIQLPQGDVIIQSSADVQPGRDIRVFVVGKKIIGAVLRKSDNDFRANFTLGGTAEWYELSQSEKETIQTIINHFDFGMVGIDFLIDHTGRLLFNEMEDVVGSRTLSEVSEVNILKEYIKLIKHSLKIDK